MVGAVAFASPSYHVHVMLAFESSCAKVVHVKSSDDKVKLTGGLSMILPFSTQWLLVKLVGPLAPEAM